MTPDRTRRGEAEALLDLLAPAPREAAAAAALLALARRVAVLSGTALPPPPPPLVRALDRVPAATQAVGDRAVAALATPRVGALLADLLEASLTPGIRQSHGAVYTHAAEIDRVLDAAEALLDVRPGRVCDPACGGGSFLHQAALRWPEKGGPLLCGLDRNPVATWTCRVRLALTDGPVSVATHDALSRPAQRAVAARFAPLDLVCGNPPYVRAEQRGRRPFAGLRHHLVRCLQPLVPDASLVAPLLGGRSNLYAAFVSLGMAWLRPGGVLAFVVSDSWLDSQVGEALQRFLLATADEVTILGEGDARTFASAGIGTVILAARRKREKGAQARVSFGARPDGSWKASPHTPEAPRPGPWGALHLRTGAAARPLLERPVWQSLGEIATLRYGTKPGIRDFFVLTRARAEALSLEPRYLVPFLASARGRERLAVTPEECPELLFVCRESRDRLLGPNNAGALAWVDSGAARQTRKGARHTVAGIPYPAVRSVQHNRPEWYSLAPRTDGDFAIPCLLGHRLFVLHLPEPLALSNTFFAGTFAGDIEPLFGLGLLNATVTLLFLELAGRPKGLGGLNLYGPELRRLHVPDPARFDARARARVAGAFTALAANPLLPVAQETGGGESARVPPARRTLDDAVCGPLGIAPATLCGVYSELYRVSQTRLARGAGKEQR